MGVAVFVIRDRFVKNNNRLVLKSLSLYKKVLSPLSLSLSLSLSEEASVLSYVDSRYNDGRT